MCSSLQYQSVKQQLQNSHIVLTYSAHMTHDVCLNVLAHCLLVNLYTYIVEVYCSVIQGWCFLHTPNGVTEESLGSTTHDSPSPHFNPNLFPGLLRPFLLLPPAFFDAQRTQLGSSTRDEPVITKKKYSTHLRANTSVTDQWTPTRRVDTVYSALFLPLSIFTGSLHILSSVRDIAHVPKPRPF